MDEPVARRRDATGHKTYSLDVGSTVPAPNFTVKPNQTPKWMTLPLSVAIGVAAVAIVLAAIPLFTEIRGNVVAPTVMTGFASVVLVGLAWRHYLRVNSDYPTLMQQAWGPIGNEIATRQLIVGILLFWAFVPQYLFMLKVF